MKGGRMAVRERSIDVTSSPDPSFTEVDRGPSSTSWIREVVRFLRYKPLGAIGGMIILAMIILAILAPVVAPYDPYELRVDHLFEPPGATFYLGTDDYGRDVFSRIVYGSRISLYVGVLAVGIGTTTRHNPITFPPRLLEAPRKHPAIPPICGALIRRSAISASVKPLTANFAAE